MAKNPEFKMMNDQVGPVKLIKSMKGIPAKSFLSELGKQFKNQGSALGKGLMNKRVLPYIAGAALITGVSTGIGNYYSDTKLVKDITNIFWKGEKKNEIKIVEQDKISPGDD